MLGIWTWGLSDMTLERGPVLQRTLARNIARKGVNRKSKFGTSFINDDISYISEQFSTRYKLDKITLVYSHVCTVLKGPNVQFLNVI
jgi:hypothetical protein